MRVHEVWAGLSLLSAVALSPHQAVKSDGAISASTQPFGMYLAKALDRVYQQVQR